MSLMTDWNAFVAAHPHGHLLQSEEWGALKSAFGWRAEHVRTPRAAALVLFRVLPLGLGTLAYVPRGPVVDWDDTDALRELQRALDALCRRRRAALLKVEPWLVDAPEHAAALAALGYRPSPQTVQAPRTILVDLAPDEDALLAAMKPKCRYNVRLAERKGVTVRPAVRADLPAFHALMAATAARDHFAVHAPTYYEKAYELFVERAGTATLLLAEGRGTGETETEAQTAAPAPRPAPLAALFVTACGPLATYLYGASADEGRNLMPAYLLQWEAMRWARARGCTRYDLLGVPDEDEATLEAQFESRADGLWGVYRFKRGFGGTLWRAVGAWDRVYNPVLYRVYREWARRRNLGQF
jgi:peptidoglycan pentaglycine glycine transferase (the first glycine)